MVIVPFQLKKITFMRRKFLEFTAKDVQACHSRLHFSATYNVFYFIIFRKISPTFHVKRFYSKACLLKTLIVILPALDISKLGKRLNRQ